MVKTLFSIRKKTQTSLCHTVTIISNSHQVILQTLTAMSSRSIQTSLQRLSVI